MENQRMLSTQEAVVGGTEGGPRKAVTHAAGWLLPLSNPPFLYRLLMPFPRLHVLHSTQRFDTSFVPPFARGIL